MSNIELRISNFEDLDIDHRKLKVIKIRKSAILICMFLDIQI